MRNLLLSILVFLTACSTKNDQKDIFISTSDIDHFWEAYDRIQQTADSSLHAGILEDLFIKKASKGQRAMFSARNYRPEEYLKAIADYPQYWASIRPKMEEATSLGKDIEEGVRRLQGIYPDMDRAEVYFTVGMFRSGGTITDGMVLIGSEISLTDSTIVTSDFPESMSHLPPLYQTNPIQNMAFLNVHELVHTLQKDHEYRLLERSVNEGIAELVAVKAMDQASTTPAILKGDLQGIAIKEAFIREMFKGRAGIDNWLYNSDRNRFGLRDLGYYVGYKIADRVYDQAEDKTAALKQMIELEYDDKKSFYAFVDRSGYFDQSVAELKKRVAEATPEIVKIEPFQANASHVDPTISTMKITFSKPMNTQLRGFDLGPKGKEHVLRITGLKSWSADKKTIEVGIELKPKHHHQVLLTSNFQTEEGYSIEPYLIEVKTK